MPEISAREALRYATDDELLKLYGVVLGGWALTLLSQVVFGATPRPVGRLIGFIVLLAGILATLAGVVAVVRKVLVESRQG